MNAENLKSWLDRKKKTEGILYRLFAVLSFLAAIVVLFLTFWLAYGVIKILWEGVSALSDLLISKKFKPSHTGCLVLSGLFMVLLIVSYMRVNPWSLGTYPKANYPRARRFGSSPRIAPLFKHPAATGQFVTEILMSGPQLLFGAFGLWRQGINIHRLETAGCADLLDFLLSQQRAVPYEELRETGWGDWLDHLRLIEGILFLEKGVKLSDDLRRELITLNPNYGTETFQS